MKYLTIGGAVLLLVALAVWLVPVLRQQRQSPLADAIDQMERVCLSGHDSATTARVTATLEQAKRALKGGASVESQDKTVRGALFDAPPATLADQDNKIRVCMQGLYNGYVAATGPAR